MKKIKLFDPAIGNEEEKSIVKTLRSHLWASGSGEGYVKEFENKFARFFHCKYSVMVNSGSSSWPSPKYENAPPINKIRVNIQLITLFFIKYSAIFI